MQLTNVVSNDCTDQCTTLQDVQSPGPVSRPAFVWGIQYNTMNNGGILPQDQWLAKHKLKFDRENLSRKQRLERYRNYASSEAPSSPAVRMPMRSGQPVPRSAKTAIAAGESDRGALIRAMADPFTACANGGYLPRVPDGCSRDTSVYKFKFNVEVWSNAEGRAFFFLTNSPFRCYVASETTSNVVSSDAGYVSQCEYNAFAAEVQRAIAATGDMPPWTADSWSIPVVSTRQNGTTDPSIGFQPAEGYQNLQDQGQAWRPLCMGAKFSNTSKVTNRQGSVVVARWPGALGAPVVSNSLLVVQGSASNGATLTGYEGQGPNYAKVQTLLGAEVLPVTEGFKAVWAPESTEGQAHWRPIHPKPYSSSLALEGLYQYSDTAATGVYILPEPCNANGDRYCALIDRLFSQNAAVINTRDVVEPTGTGLQFPIFNGNCQGLYFENYVDAGSAAQNDEITSFAMRDVLHGYNQADMLVDDTALIAVFEGCEPNTLIGTIEVALGVEYIPDSRTIVSGNGPQVGRVSMPKSKQLDVHHATIQAMHQVPTVVEKGVDVMGQIVSGVKTGIGIAESVAPYVEMALSAVAALL